MEASDWRAKLLPRSREKIVVKIIETLKKCVPSSKINDLAGIKKLAESFEEMIYAAAKDEDDYKRKIAVKMISVRGQSSRTVVPNSSQSRPSCSGETRESHGIQSQVDKHRQSLNPHSTNQSQHQLSLNAENNVASSGIYASIRYAQPPLSDLTVTAMPNVVTKVSNLRTTSGISQNSVGNSVGQGMYSGLSPNNPIQVQGRQRSLQVATQQNHQQPQKLLQDSFQLQQQPLKQDYIAPSQSSAVSDHLQSQQSSCQQSSQPLLMKHPQTVVRQLQPTQQVPVTHQNESPMLGKPLLPSHQQPQLMKKNMAATSMTQNRLIGKQSSAPYSLQQRQGLPCLQKNSQNLQQEHSQGQQNNTHQQQLAGRSNFSVLQQQKQLLGKQCDNLSMRQTHVAMEGQTQQTASASASLSTQGQQLQPPLPERQLISQSQPEKVQRLPNPSQQDGMENFQRSGALNPRFEKTFANIGDWQEEIYQKVEGLKIRYLKQLNGIWQTLTNRLQQVQQHGSVPQQPKTDQIEKLILVLNQIIAFLNVSKSKITPAHGEHLGLLEKKIGFVLHSTGKKSVSSSQQGKLYPDVKSVQQLPQPQTQTSQVQRLEDQKIPQLQSTVSQQNYSPSLQHESKSPLSEPGTLQQNMMHSIEHLTISEKENSVKVMQQVAKGSLRSPASIPNQANFNTLMSISHMNVSQSSVTPLELSSDTFQNMHLKQRRDNLDVLTQKPKQEFQKHKTQHQLVHQNRQILQRQQVAKPQAEENKQNQLNDVNGLKVGLGMSVKEPHHQKNAVNDSRVKRGRGVKSGLILQHQSGGLPSVYNSQHSNSGASFPISSPKVSCSPLAQHSPQIDLQNLPTPLTKAGSHFHTANSTSAIPSSSLIQSSMSGSCGKLTSDTSSLPDAENTGHCGPSSEGPASSLVICTPGISASPFLEESSALDGIDCKMSTIISDEPSVAEQPLQRLINVVSSISSQAFSASITDIGSVMCLSDWISSSPPANGSSASIGEDLTKSCLEPRYLIRQNDSYETRKMKRLLSAMSLNIYPTNGGIHDGYRRWIDMEEPELESSTTSSTKRPRIEAKHALSEEIREINQQLIDTVVVISDEDTIPTAAATEGGEGTIVKCSFSAVAISPNFKSQLVSAQMSPIQPLRLLVPTNYPYTSPILLDERLLDAREDPQDLSVKVKSKLNLSLRSLLEPLSLERIIMTWDFCARSVLSEYAQQNGGGSFSSKYGTWENCLSAA